MERKRLQQQRMKQQQQERFCVSQQDLTEAIARMKPARRATHTNLLNVSSSSSTVSLCSVETLTVPSVSELIKGYEARASSTPYVSAQDFLPIDNIVATDRVESNCCHPTKNIKVNNNDDNISSSSSPPPPPPSNNNNQTLTEKIHPDQVTGDREQGATKKEQIHQTLDNDRYNKREQTSSTSSSYYSIESAHQPAVMLTRTRSQESANSKRQNRCFSEVLNKETQLNNALADLISLSNDANTSSSVSSSSRSLANMSQQRRASSVNDNSNSISSSIALLNNLLETFELDNEEYKSQLSKKTNVDSTKANNKFCCMTSDNVCANCKQSFAINEQIINAAGQIWHTQCFVCAQCFQPFENGLYFEHDGRKYCERDFQMLFAPCCAECAHPIVGRVIRAIQKCFHPDCFRCHVCHIPLLDIGFSKNNGRALCRECHLKEKQKDPTFSQPICSTCHVELDENAQDVRGLLYCQTCYNKLDLPVCAACRRLIDDRVVSALGKQWHVEHFCCARCGQAFLGNKHFEHKGLAYCETDYHFLFGSACFICSRVLVDGAYVACNKKYCVDHFACSTCETKMNEKSKFFDVDATPVCKPCYGKLPSGIRKSLEQNQKKKPLSSILKQTIV
ncbi:unnamed protein product [Adineta ricciae]|uniref:LIM zinc-binding domain-containing protein n=1 Tax=Adineta ricciae TaxID=249248 RepID=A0A813ZM66_ADIRI|nr:unnamed protein product [Adineta ricciae]